MGKIYSVPFFSFLHETLFWNTVCARAVWFSYDKPGREKGRDEAQRLNGSARTQQLVKAVMCSTGEKRPGTAQSTRGKARMVIAKIWHPRIDFIPRKTSNYNVKDLQQKLDSLQLEQPVWILTNELVSIRLNLHEEKDRDTAETAGTKVLELQDCRRTRRSKWKELRELSKGSSFRAVHTATKPCGKMLE